MSSFYTIHFLMFQLLDATTCRKYVSNWAQQIASTIADTYYRIAREVNTTCNSASNTNNELRYLPSIVIIAGPALTGKSTVAQQFESLGYHFIEGDDLHPEANVAKMKRGESLTDADRYPWLTKVATTISEKRKTYTHVVATCSALRPEYREKIRQCCEEEMHFVYLTASFETLFARAQQRQNHFFDASKNPHLLQNQLANSKPPYEELNSLVIELDEMQDQENQLNVFEAIVNRLKKYA